MTPSPICHPTESLLWVGPQCRMPTKRASPDRTNIKNSWVGEHRIVSAPSGDMAYEYGTVHVSYDDTAGHHEFEAVMLHVYKANGGVCQMAAMTMHPLGEESKK